jgi:peptidoglycan/LPS O-acetylase OafA/YrhL
MHRIKILDSMRGVAALLVVFHHVYTRFNRLFLDHFSVWANTVMAWISDLNVQAVLFFFFLSGFSICLSLKNGLPISKTAFNEYAYRRLKRILPLYYFAILIAIITGLLTRAIYINPDFSIKNLLGNVFFLQCSKSYRGNWFAPYGDNGPLWSLSFEMFYYFLLPILLLALLRFKKATALTVPLNRLALILTFILSVVCTLLNKFFFFPFIAFGTLLYVWYAGFFCAWLYVQKKIVPGTDILLLFLAAFILFAMNTVAPAATLNKLLFGAAIAAGFFLLFIIRKQMPADAIAGMEKPFNFLFYKIGTGSYALYLLHYPAMMLLKNQAGTTLFHVLTAVALLIRFSIWIERCFVKQK